MSEEWDKVKEDWKSFGEYDLIHIWAAGDTLQAETKVLKYENKELIDRNKYLEGLTDGDVKLITGLQVENKQLREKWDKVVEYLQISGVFLECDESIVLDVLKKGTENHQNLEAIRCVINDPPTYSIPFLGNPAPEVQDYIKRMDAWYCKLLNTAQNTKEKCA